MLPPATIGPGEFFPVVGVGPHPKPWPSGENFDPELLENGDRRNVLDQYRYWSVEAIVADLNTKRHSLQIAIENWQHDLNIGNKRTERKKRSKDCNQIQRPLCRRCHRTA